MAKKKSKLGAKLKNALKKSPPPAIWTPRPSILCCQKIPRPLHGVVPREILGRNWWNQTRLLAYKSTDYHCLACGVSKYDAKYHQWLEGHEVYQIDYVMGVAEYVETVPLCHFCHNYIHDGRLAALLEVGKVHHAKYAAIIQHGDEVLAKAGIVRERYEGPMADWEDWRLILNNNEYKPKYRTPDEWYEAMSRAEVEE